MPNNFQSSKNKLGRFAFPLQSPYRHLLYYSNNLPVSSGVPLRALMNRHPCFTSYSGFSSFCPLVLYMEYIWPSTMVDSNLLLM